MTYKQVTDSCFAPGQLDKADFAALKSQALKALDELRAEEKAGKLPIISLARETADLAEINQFAANIKQNFETLVVLGTGGSSLCGHALTGFKQGNFSTAKPKVVFMQNIDPATFSEFFATNDIKKTAFLTISKSGNSIETIAQFLVCLELAKSLDIKKHFFSITMPGDNPLRRISAKHNIKTYDHDPNVGGRFSILSLVGLMPGVTSGVDAAKLRKGAWEFYTNLAEQAAEAAALHISFMRQSIWHNVLMTYPDRLEDLNIWYRQIWAESIGKNGTGSTPIKAMGTIDQHSQMQLFLAGRKDKFYNFITLKTTDSKFKIPKAGEPEFDYLSGKSLGDLINAEQKATIETLVNNKRPVRAIELPKLDDEEMGMLIMHLMLETIITAKLLGVNPFDQPAVEEGKRRTCEYMRKNG